MTKSFLKLSSRALSLIVSVLSWPSRVAEHRRVLAELAGLDDHTLKDMGLTRQDLRDATGLPAGADPTWQLAERARERAEAALRARGHSPQGPHGGIPQAWRQAAE